MSLLVALDILSLIVALVIIVILIRGARQLRQTNLRQREILAKLAAQLIDIRKQQDERTSTVRRFPGD